MRATEGNRRVRTWQKLAGLMTGAVLALSVIGGGTALAKVPGWGFTIVATPLVVTPGSSAGFVVTISNTGKSNISALYLSTDMPASDPLSVPTYISTATYTGQLGPATPCDPAGSGPLDCSFGNLVAGGTVTLTVALPTPLTGNTYAFNFLAFGNGNTPSDGGTSHGDTLKGPASVGLSADKNFAGGFTVDTTDLATNTSLSKKNPQSSAVTPPSAFIPVTIQDGLATYPGAGTDPCATLSCIGDWVKLNVNNGHSGPVKIVLVLYGPSVPNTATVDNINLLHEGVTISARCDASVPPTNIECITVTKVGNNFQIVGWLAHNGSIRAY
ncbi:MAG: hypothetical protein ACXW4H_05400 [Candidatus Limnocylindrales bacterium]